MSKELMPWAQDAASAFYREYRGGNCSCHISPPWGELHEVMAEEAVYTLARFIDTITAKHLAEMAATKKVGSA
jgi:hypothetical protein